MKKAFKNINIINKEVSSIEKSFEENSFEENHNLDLMGLMNEKIFLDSLDAFLWVNNEKSEKSKLGTIEIDYERLKWDAVKIKRYLFILEKIVWGLRFITRENYVNKAVNIPCVNKLLSLIYKKDVSSRYYNVKVNILFYNLFLVILIEIMTKMTSWVLVEENYDEDLYNDLFNLQKETYAKINPVIREKLSSKGISIILNTFTGFDSEYELESSLENKNSLLSIQLASNTNYYVRVPKSVSSVSIKADLLSDSKMILYGEKSIIAVGERSLDILLSRMRLNLWKEKDDLIIRLHNKMSSITNVKAESGDYIIYSSPKTEVVTMLKYASEDLLNGSYSSIDLMKDSVRLKNHEHEKSLLSVIEMINDLENEDSISEKIRNRIKECVNKHTSRFNLIFKNGMRLSISISKQLYIGMHESTADLSMLSDFEEFKERLDIVQRSFVTIGKPLITEGIAAKVYIRDTILIAPLGAKSLAAVGSIYGENYKKIDIGSYRGKMKSLLETDKELFKKYAIRDAEITLKHLNEMEGFNFISTSRMGVPLTMSGIGKAYVIKWWSQEGYQGYQGENGVKLGNFAKVLTPNVARSLPVSRFLVPYITGYRGGRNESFMYGIDEIEKGSHVWYDYDLTSAYTTVMCILGHPDVEKAKRIFNQTVLKMDDIQFLFSYMILEVEFEFKPYTKYPCLPVKSGDLEIYPLKGSTIITGPEYLVAKKMDCKMYVTDGVMIPFGDRKYKQKDVMPWMKKFPILGKIAPYRSLMSYLQEQRRKHPKKSFLNLMYKEIGNSIYGQVAMGMSNKTSFDVKSKQYVKVEGGVLSNPILSSYITGFTRAIIGECLNNIQELKGRVISVTTDGFITDVQDLERKIIGEIQSENRICLELYKVIRRILTTNEEKYDDSGLEVKNEEKEGIISLKTRCQYGYTEGGISAATGFQSKFYEKSFVINEISKRIKDPNEDNVLEFVQTGLRSASDVYKEGGNVIAKYSDRLFSLSYDNKRSIEKKNEKDLCSKLLDSKPWVSVNEYENVRTLTDAISKTVHKQNLFYSVGKKSYKSYLETGIRGFIKVCFITKKDINNPLLNEYGIPQRVFNTYQDLIDFLYRYEPAREVKLSISSISKLKMRNTISRAVPRTKENEMFIDYIKENIKTFNSDLFFREFSKKALEMKRVKSLQ